MKKNKILLIALTMIMSFGINSMYANNNKLSVEVEAAKDDTTATEEVKKKKLKGKIEFSGSVDGYYEWNTNNPGDMGNGGASGVGRIFDLEHNRFAFGMVRAKIAYVSPKTEVVGELAFGPAGELANFGNTGTGLVIKQAYLSHYFTDKFSVTFGQFGTHIGYELVDAPDNYNYSLSYLFGNGPFYHTGLKLQYDFTEKISLMAGVVNGWDNISDNNKAKSVVAQIATTPSEDFSLYLNWIGGNEDDKSVTNGDSLKSFKQMIDLTTAYQVTDNFLIGINGAFGTYKLGDADPLGWGGVALYLNYDICDLFGLGARAEYFDDDRGVQYLGAKYTGFTLTGKFSLMDGHILIKPEVRHDRTNKGEYFADESGTNLKKHQTTVGVAFIGAF